MTAATAATAAVARKAAAKRVPVWVGTRTISRIGSTRMGSRAATTVRGRAWSGSGRISSVEVDLGEGWTEAKLDPSRLGSFAWVSWRKRWVPGRKGRTTIAARATDEKGNVQPLEPFENRFQYGYNAVQRVVVFVR